MNLFFTLLPNMVNNLCLLLGIAGLLLLVLGYRSNNRHLLLAAALCIGLGGSLDDFVVGFMGGVQAAGAPA
jgi:hypothetical protein